MDHQSDLVARYTVGPARRPAIKHDNGFLDVCVVRKPTAGDYLTLGAWELKYRTADLVMSHRLADGLAAYNHFLHGNGADRKFSYERYVQMDPSGATTLASALGEVRRAAQALVEEHFAARPGTFTFRMSGTAIPCGRPDDTLFPYPQTENWQKAIGAHIIWLSAVVGVNVGPTERRFDVTAVLNAEDRYNFNPGMKDIASGIPDDANGKLECSGLGKQYMSYATLTRRLTFAAAPRTCIGSASFGKTSGAPDGRVRQPADRRTSLLVPR